MDHLRVKLGEAMFQTLDKVISNVVRKGMVAEIIVYRFVKVESKCVG